LRVGGPFKRFERLAEDAFNACLPLLTAYHTELAQNPGLCAAYQQVKDTQYAQLQPEQRKLVDNALRDFRLSGVALDPALIPTPEGKTPALVVVTKLMELGLLVPPAGPNTIRLLPPLNVTADEIDAALVILREGLIAI
jgi:4-aminobutyrate aminotransferase-like enzyme